MPMPVLARALELFLPRQDVPPSTRTRACTHTSRTMHQRERKRESARECTYVTRMRAFYTHTQEEDTIVGKFQN
jgi:hypothetical protein